MSPSPGSGVGSKLGQREVFENAFEGRRSDCHSVPFWIVLLLSARYIGR